MVASAHQVDNQSAKSNSKNKFFFGKVERIPFFQPQLTVNTPGDVYEQEADRVADQVMRMKEEEEPIVQRMPLTPVSGVQRKCTECEQEEQGQVQRKEAASSDSGGKSAPSIVSDVISSGGGQPMDGGTRQFMESRFGQDFGQVRIHTDSRAVESASAIQARAYTSGRDVVFGAGEYQPGSESGKRLLAHELVHVGQQKVSGTKVQRSHRLENDPNDATGISCPVAYTSPNTSLSEIISFGLNSNTISGAGLSVLQQFVQNWHASGWYDRVRIDGYASIDGPPGLNWRLSCNRAQAILRELTYPSDGSPGIPMSFIDFFAQGETDQFSDTNLTANRIGVVSLQNSIVPPTPPSPVSSCRIDVRATHIGGILSSLPIWHLFIVYQDSSGTEFFFRGGPGGSCLGVTGEHGTIIGTSGPYVAGTVDWSPGAPSVTAMTGSAACGKDSCLAAELSRIDRTCTPYTPMGPNSNTVVGTLLDNCGIPRAKPVAIAPGFDNPVL